jgi:hypothetical protein
MPLNDPVALFKDSKEAFDNFLRALSTLHSTGVLEFLRERGQVRATSESSINYVAAQAAKANFSLGYNQALNELSYFRELFLTHPDMSTQAPIDFGALDKALQNGDLEPEEIEALQHGKPIPVLTPYREPGTSS